MAAFAKESKPEGMSDEDWKKMQDATKLISETTVDDVIKAKDEIDSEVVDGLKDLGFEVNEPAAGY
jgi:hypothetical protein